MAYTASYIYKILDQYSGPLSRIAKSTNLFKRNADAATLAANRMSTVFQRLPAHFRHFKRAIGNPAFQAQMASFANSSRDVAYGLDMSGKASARAAAKFGRTSMAIDRLGMRFESLPQNMRNFKRTVGSPVFMSQMMQLEKQTKDIAQNINKMGKASGRFAIQSKALRAGRQVQPGIKALARSPGIGNMRDVGGKMTAGVTLPIVGAGIMAMKTAIDFQDAFTGVRKTVTASEPEFQAMLAQFKQMSTEIPVSATELMQIGESAGQLNIAKENITSFTKTIAMLGATTNMSGEEGAKQLARFANITGMSQKNFDRLASTIVYLGNNLATSEAEIVNMAMGLGGAGRTIGLTEAQIMAFAGSLSSIGIEAEAGSTAFSRMFYMINDAVGKNGPMLQKFAKVAAVDSKKFAETFKKDAAGAVMMFIKGLNAMPKDRLNIVLEALDFKDIRLKKALVGAAGAVDLFGGALGGASQAWIDNNALINEAKLRFKTWSSQLKMSYNKLLLFANELGIIIVPLFIHFIDLIMPIVKWFSDLSLEIKKSIIIMGGAVAVVGPLLIAFGAIAAAIGAVGGTVALVVAAFSLVAGAWTVLITSSPKLRQSFISLLNAFSPIIEVGEKIVLLIGKALVSAFGGSENSVKTFGDALSVIVDLAALILTTFFKLVTFLPRLGLTLIENFDKVKTAIMDIVTQFMKVVDVVSKLKSGDFSGAWQTYKDMGAGISESLKSAGKLAGKTFSDVWEGKDFFSGAANEKAKARQDNKLEVSGQIGVTASGTSKVESANINLNRGSNLALMAAH